MCKFLVLFIDERLDWDTYINTCNNKLISALYAINEVNKYLPVSPLKTIYYTLISPTSHMESFCGHPHINPISQFFSLCKRKNCLDVL